MHLTATAVDAVTRSLPCLLTSSDSDDQLSRGSSWSVKNTFVHVDPEEQSDYDDEEMCLPIKSKSAPNIIDMKAQQVNVRLMLPLPSRREKAAVELQADEPVFQAIATAPSPCRSVATATATARTPRVRFDLTPKVCGADAAGAEIVLGIPGEDDSEEQSEKIAAGADAPAEATTPHLLPLSLSDSWTLGKVRVKNTFVHVVPDGADDFDDDLPTRSTSMPSNLARAGCATPDASAVFPADAAELLRHASDPAPSATPAPAPAPGLVAPQRASVGSALHGTGRCKPCAWFWKPQSCRWGIECGHCHECPEGELRKRKKEKIAGLKLEKQSTEGEALTPPQ